MKTLASQNSTQIQQEAANRRQGLLYGLLGVVTFSVTLPATRAAAPELGGVFTGIGRATVAAFLAALLLAAMQERLPHRKHWKSLALVALGVVFAFPLCTAVALRSLPASHGAVLAGLLPASTAFFAVLRAKERSPLAFWVTCGLGVIATLIFAATEGAGKPQMGDLWLLLAVTLASLGYAEGGQLAREIGGWRVICWALVFSLPVLLLPACIAVSQDIHSGQFVAASPRAWIGFGYLCLVSMFLGFFAWYRGLALGGVARIGQLQLMQPVLALFWAALLLGEMVRPQTVGAALLLIGISLLSQRFRTPATASAHAAGP